MPINNVNRKHLKSTTSFNTALLLNDGQLGFKTQKRHMSVNKKREMLVPILMFFAWVIATLLLVIAHIKGDNLIRLLGSGIYVPFMVALFSVISKATTKLLEDGVNFGPRNWQFAGRPFSEFLELYSLYVIHLFTWMSVIILGVITACVFEQYFMGTLALTLTYRMYIILRYMDFVPDQPWIGSSKVTQLYFAFFSIGGTKLPWKTICGFNTPRAVSFLEIRMYKRICRYENKWYIICLSILALVYQLESYWTPIADEVLWFVLILQFLPFILGLMEGRRQFSQFSGYNNTLNEDN